MKNFSFLHVVSICTAAAMTNAALPASAQQAASTPGMNLSSSFDTGLSPSTLAFTKTDERLMKEMSASAYSGDTDKDFVSRMIPHNLDVIEMAEVELKYGNDPDLERFAKSIIVAQRTEIGYMMKWQAKHGSK
jgi:uncharacterized protein (DUF305 family)